MDKPTLQQILQSPYSSEKWQDVLRDVFGATRVLQKADESLTNRLTDKDRELAERAAELGSFETADGRLVGLYQVDLTDRPRIWQNRVGLRSLLRNVYTHDVDAALVVFVQCDKWRLSLISEIRVLDADGNVIEQKTEPKRYTYLLGNGETVRTPVERLDDLTTSDRKLETLIKAFSVEGLNKDFFREYKIVFDALVAEVGKSIKEAESARLFAQRLLNRLMFLYFIQKKGWMTFDGDANYLRRIFDESKRKKEKFYSDRLYYVFFWGLSNHNDSKEIHNQNELEEIRGIVPYLNGGLFEAEKDGLDEKGKVSVSNERFEEILNLFERYNFTIDESTPFEVQVAVDPEMLGKVFEELVTGRHASGSYYTPRTVVSFMCREALKHSLDGIESPEAIAALVDENDGKPANNPEKVLDRLKALKVCDPACGSGAYLLGMLQELLHVREALFASTAVAKDAQYKWKREIIENNIYGVDQDKFATQIAALRLWLSLAIESDDPHPLPNLKYKIGCGDSLLAPLETIGQTPDLHRRALIEQFKARKKEYTDADDHFAKAEAETEIERLRVEIAQMFHHLPPVPKANEIVLAEAGITPLKEKIERLVKIGDKGQAEKFQKELKRLDARIKELKAAANAPLHYDTGNVFDWSVEFAEVFEDGGFDVVLANPPYIQLQRMGEMADKYSKAGFETFARTGDIYCLFYELGQKLLRTSGLVCYITSNKWMRAAYGEKTRRFLAEKTDPIMLVDFAGQQIFEGATVDTNILMFAKTETKKQETLACTIPENALDKLSVFVRQHGSISKFTSSESWIILNTIEQRIKSKIETIGTPLKDWDVRIYRGILTGYNEAFVINKSTRDRLILQDPKSAEIIRPILRGRDIKRYGFVFADQWLICTHNGVREKGIEPINVDRYPAIKKHLNQHWEHLEPRADQGVTSYNLRNCAYIEDFSRQKIVWAELARTGNAFAFDDSGYLLLNTCYILTLPKSDEEIVKYMLAVLNSKAILFYMDLISSKLDVTGWRWLKQFVECLPVPREAKTQGVIAKSVSLAISTRDKNESFDKVEFEINQLIYYLFELSEGEIAFIENLQKPAPRR